MLFSEGCLQLFVMTLGNKEKQVKKEGCYTILMYSGMQEKVTQRVGWVENPTSPQAVWNVGFDNPTYPL